MFPWPGHRSLQARLPTDAGDAFAFASVTMGRAVSKVVLKRLSRTLMKPFEREQLF